ncbi:MAG: hypothetical protein GXP24_14315 [Planctomycetes bacterium]|nr:hypothetical protein [Planctomycetota bacterium]
MSLTQQRSRNHTILFALFVSGGILVHALRADVFVDESPGDRSRPSAVASDLAPVPAEAVAREVLRLQQQMGGSVVNNRTGLQGWNHSPGPVKSKKSLATGPRRAELPANHYQPGRQRPANKVNELREAAWQLDTTAHRLEKLDLYDQADALRDVADQLRRDAREMKQAEKLQSQYEATFDRKKE